MAGILFRIFTFIFMKVIEVEFGFVYCNVSGLVLGEINEDNRSAQSGNKIRGKCGVSRFINEENNKMGTRAYKVLF